MRETLLIGNKGDEARRVFSSSRVSPLVLPAKKTFRISSQTNGPSRVRGQYTTPPLRIEATAFALYTCPFGNAIGGLSSSIASPVTRHTSRVAERRERGSGRASSRSEACVKGSSRASDVSHSLS